MPDTFLPLSATDINRERRSALLASAGAALLALAPAVGRANEPNSATSSGSAASVSWNSVDPDANDDNLIVPIYDEPRHHVIMENGVMRVMRVMIPPGHATLWHAQNLDFVNTIIGGSHNIIARKGEGPGEPVEMKTGSVRYGDYQRSPIVDRVSNVGATLNHQIAFEITDLARRNYGNADRSHATNFSVILDKPHVRGWRLKLQPGETTPVYRQDGPGIRVVLSGARLIDRRPGELGQQISLRPGDALFTTPGLIAVTNAAEEPLEIMEYELR